MNSYPLKIKLKDGPPLVIREIEAQDEDKLLLFFKSLPLSSRQYLKMDVTQVENIRLRMTPDPFHHVSRLVAEADGKIWGDATLRAMKTGWTRHVCEIRCIVHPDYQRKEVGSHLLWELFQQAVSGKYQRIFCELVPEQSAAISVLTKLGFKLALQRKNHVKDLEGKKHDLHVYTMDVKGMWERLKDQFHAYDTSFEHC